MRLPDPIANTTTEAYLAYKAGVLNIGDLKPSLYDPYLHYDAWLAYWAGLVDTYPIHDVGKNLFNENDVVAVWINESGAAQASATWWQSKFIPVLPNTTYTVTTHQIPDSGSVTSQIQWHGYSSKEESSFISGQAGLEQLWGDDVTLSMTFTTSSDCHYVRIGYRQERQEMVQLEEGSTATPYEPYTGTPEILTDEEALVAYLSGVTNTYPEEYSDPIDARITGYLRYLVSARFGRPDYPVNNIEFYLSLMKPPIVTNDTPSSNIELDNTAWAELIDVKMYGDTSQQTYTGKNLYAVANSEHRGVTETVNADGSITLVGTATGSNAYLIQETAPVSLMANGETYICSWSGADSLPSGVEIRLGINNGGSWVRNLMSTMSGSTKSRTFTANTAGGDAIRCEIYVASGSKADVSNIKIQLEEGSDITTFEPYVGGVTAPNPKYPQAVQTVTGRQTVKVQGKNLFDKDNLEGHYFYNSQTYRPNAQNLDWDCSQPIPVESSTTYTISTSLKSGESFSNAQLIYWDADKNGVGSVWGDIRSTLTTGANVRFITIAYNNTTWENVQLEKGSPATTYEPYQSQEYEVNLVRKNWAEIPEGTKNGITCVRRSDGGYALSGTATALTHFAVSVPLSATQHTLSFRVTKTLGTVYVRTRSYYPGDTGAIEDTISTANLTGSVTSSKSFDEVMVDVGSGTTIPDGYIIYPQLELGSTATAFEPALAPIELCKYGDSVDSIYKNDDNVWILSKKVMKRELMGGETYSPRTNTSPTHSKWRLAFNILRYPILNATSLYCTHFIANGGANTQAYSQDAVCGVEAEGYKQQLVFSVSNSIATTATEFQTWVAAHPMQVYYAIDGTVNTPITNRALIAQLDALAAAKSYNDKTYITVEATDPNLPALLKVEAGEYR